MLRTERGCKPILRMTTTHVGDSAAAGCPTRRRGRARRPQSESVYVSQRMPNGRPGAWRAHTPTRAPCVNRRTEICTLIVFAHSLTKDLIRVRLVKPRPGPGWLCSASHDFDSRLAPSREGRGAAFRGGCPRQGWRGRLSKSPPDQ